MSFFVTFCVFLLLFVSSFVTFCVIFCQTSAKGRIPLSVAHMIRDAMDGYEEEEIEEVNEDFEFPEVKEPSEVDKLLLREESTEDSI